MKLETSNDSPQNVKLSRPGASWATFSGATARLCRVRCAGSHRCPLEDEDAPRCDLLWLRSASRGRSRARPSPALRVESDDLSLLEKGHDQDPLRSTKKPFGHPRSFAIVRGGIPAGRRESRRRPSPKKHWAHESSAIRAHRDAVRARQGARDRAPNYRRRRGAKPSPSASPSRAAIVGRQGEGRTGALSSSGT
jgi:hypothetical protein